jgi:hypothetical protein
MIYANIHAEGHYRNSMFALEDSVHRHNSTHIPRALRAAFLIRGIELNTPDINQGREIAFDLFMEGREFKEDGIPKFLVALENPNINHLNVDRDYCRRFRKVFAWDKRLHDLPNVVPIMVPNRLEFEPFLPFEQREIFSCLINANKAFRRPQAGDLYQERLKVIRWYEKNAPEYFELYGLGWEKPAPAYDAWGKVKRSLSSLGAKWVGYKPFPSYRGELREKSSVLRRSKFAWCYENTIGPDNYITEKIFDSFLSGCVPIYWGAENVLEHIPAECFINRINFANMEMAHRYLAAMPAADYSGYQKSITDFLGSDSVQCFNAEYFVSEVVETLVLNL